MTKITGIIQNDVSLTGVIQKTASLTGSLGTSNKINVSIIGSGARGESGLSAYEIWLGQGHEGTEEEFIAYLSAVQPDSYPASSVIESENRMFLSLKEKEQLSTYVHDQIASSSEWMIEHNLDKYPSVSVVDTSGNLVVGSVEYLSTNNLQISFTSEFSGKAYLN